MSTWIVTTGQSLMASSRCWSFDNRKLLQWLTENDFRPTADLQQDTAAWPKLHQLKQARTKLLEPGAADKTDLREWAARMAEVFRTECWDVGRRHTLPAELATLVMLEKLEELGSDDRLLLVGGYTNRPTVHLLRAMLLKAGRTEEGVSVEADQRLDPLEEGEFDRNMERLWHQVVQPRLDDAQLVLTGGYKAVLLWLALALPVADRPPVWYLSEDGDATLIKLTSRVAAPDAPPGTPATPQTTNHYVELGV